MRLIIVRHGETIENKKKIVQGHLHGSLSETGILQAEKVAERLRDEKIDYFYSSDLKRAHDTAKKIYSFHKEKGIPFELREELRERKHGEAEGKKRDEVNWEEEIKGRENNDELVLRAKKFLDEIREKHKDDSVILVCHGGILKAIISIIMKKEFSEMGEVFRQTGFLYNTSVSVFLLKENDSYIAELFNCVKHLEDY